MIIIICMLIINESVFEAILSASLSSRCSKPLVCDGGDVLVREVDVNILNKQ
jgi:hypothetical protein